MNNQISVKITAKKSILAFIVAVFLVLALMLVFLPNKASADTNTTNSSYYIPVNGYYYYTDANGNAHPCDFSHCANYVPTNSNSYNYYQPLTYNPYSPANTQYPILQYVPYNNNSPYSNNSYYGYGTNGYSYGANNYIYPIQTYVPYEKVGNTYKLGTPQNIPYYSMNANGLMNNSYGYGYGGAYNNGYNGYNGGFYTYPNNGYRNNSGFTMTNQNFW